MDRFIVETSGYLKGRISIGGAKNTVLPIMAACLLSDGECVINGISPLSDIYSMKEILQGLGAKAKWHEQRKSLIINGGNINSTKAHMEEISKIRASFLIAGPLLSKYGHCVIPMPGGCSIGSRPVDLHLKGFSALGAEINMEHGCIHLNAKKLFGERIYLDFPSVGATENIMMAAVLAEGVTIIENAATEPEIVDLANFLNCLGAQIRGAGTGAIKITGTRKLKGGAYSVIPDRIEAGTFMAAVAAKGGHVFVENVMSEHLKPISAKLKETGVEIFEKESGIEIISPGAKSLKGVDIKTLPHPGFPTDMQAQFMSILALCSGNSIISETVFENRFMHVPELARMGADIRIDSGTAYISGVGNLSGANVRATDLRAGAGLVIAALCADGMTEISDIYHIDRGYWDFDNKLRQLGAKISRANDFEKMLAADM